MVKQRTWTHLVSGISEIAAITEDLLNNGEVVVGYYDYMKNEYFGERRKDVPHKWNLPGEHMILAFVLHAKISEDELKYYVDSIERKYNSITLKEVKKRDAEIEKKCHTCFYDRNKYKAGMCDMCLDWKNWKYDNRDELYHIAKEVSL